jgi:4-diphosphocytidyl-2-C-methyl-D-erythritol kinase
MRDRVRVRSLAKINLDLRVLHKRADGFHELRTIFQTISLADSLTIEYRRGRTRVDIQSNLEISGNIIERAAHSVLSAAGKTGQVGFVLRKRIPLGGGLGGGSSNAAAVLLALPILIGKHLPLNKLMELAEQLGSDVPFFLLGGTAVGLGRGTELYPLPDLPARPTLLIAPGIHCSTAQAYAALGRTAEDQRWVTVLKDFQRVAWGDLSTAPSRPRLGNGGFGTRELAGGVNDFESVVFPQHPRLKSIKGKLLKLGARPALMSGSGSSVFGIFESRGVRDQAAQLFRKEFTSDQVYPVTIVSRSRYQALWRRQLAVPVDSNLWPPQDRYEK